MTPAKAFGILLAIIVLIGAYLALTALVGIGEYWPGFLFLLSWGLIEELRIERLAKAAIGAAAGTVVALTPALLGPSIGGMPALVVMVVASLAATYAMIMGWLPIAVNAAFMVCLTVVSISHIGGAVPPVAILQGLAAGILFFGGIGVAAWSIAKLRAKTTTPSPA